MCKIYFAAIYTHQAPWNDLPSQRSRQLPIWQSNLIKWFASKLVISVYSWHVSRRQDSNVAQATIPWMDAFQPTNCTSMKEAVNILENYAIFFVTS